MPNKTLKENESFDLIVKGEGEETLVDITNKYSNKDKVNFEDVKGIVYRDPDTGNLKDTQERPLIKDLDSLPFLPDILFHLNPTVLPKIKQVE